MNDEKLPSAGNVLQALLNMKAAATLKTPSKRSSYNFYGMTCWDFSPYKSRFPTDVALYLPDLDKIAAVVEAWGSSPLWRENWRK